MRLIWATIRMIGANSHHADPTTTARLNTAGLLATTVGLATGLAAFAIRFATSEHF